MGTYVLGWESSGPCVSVGLGMQLILHTWVPDYSKGEQGIFVEQDTCSTYHLQAPAVYYPYSPSTSDIQKTGEYRPMTLSSWLTFSSELSGGKNRSPFVFAFLSIFLNLRLFVLSEIQEILDYSP